MRITILLLTASLLIGGCRSVRKSSSSQDSASFRTVQNRAAYDREIVTEYEYIEVPVEVIREVEKGQTDTARKVIPVPVIARQRVRESGTTTTTDSQAAVSSEATKQTEKDLQLVIYWLAGGVIGSVLLTFLMFFLLYRRIR